MIITYVLDYCANNVEGYDHASQSSMCLQNVLLSDHAGYHHHNCSLTVSITAAHCCYSPMPLRSSGCITCRKRKVGCDGRRPACARCASHGVPFAGYVRQQDAPDFRDENNSAASHTTLRHLKTRTYRGTKDSFGSAILTCDDDRTATPKRSSRQKCNVSSKPFKQVNTRYH